MLIKVMDADTNTEARVNVLHVMRINKLPDGRTGLTLSNGATVYTHNSLEDIDTQLHNLFNA